MMDVRVYAGGPFAENTYLLVGDDGRCALVDPGAPTDQALADIESEGLTVESVLLTHAHLDHIEGLAAVRRVTSAPIYLHPLDRPLYDAGPKQAAAFGQHMEELPPPDRELSHGIAVEVAGVGLEVRHAPGHAPGHVIFYAPEEGWALSGDVVFLGSIGRTDLPGGDFQTLIASIRREVLTLPDSVRLLPGHGPETTVRHERVGNPFLIPHYGGTLA